MVMTIHRKKELYTSIMVLVLVIVSIFLYRHLVYASVDDEPYSIVILAGQSWAEGTNSYRNALPNDSNGMYKQHFEPADGATQLWWAGADGKGPKDGADFLAMFYSGVPIAGWLKSGGDSAVGAQRLQTLSDNLQRGGMVGPELGIGRELYTKGRRKTIILKVSYGFQSLAKSNSPIIPFDFNAEPGRNKSYQRIITEFNELTGYLHSIGKSYTVDGLYWLQGGTDALQDSFANQYQANFTNFVQSAFIDFQLHPMAKIVIGKMSLKDCLENSYPLTIYQYCGFPYAASVDPLAFEDLAVAHTRFAGRMSLVRNAQQAVADSDNRITIFDMNDIAMSNDHIHNSEVGNIDAGRRFINMYKLPPRFDGSSDYDGDGISNKNEDNGRGASCQLPYNATNNGNLGDDDTDCDGFPDYLDKINGPGSGLVQ